MGNCQETCLESNILYHFKELNDDQLKEISGFNSKSHQRIKNSSVQSEKNKVAVELTNPTISGNTPEKPFKIRAAEEDSFPEQESE